MTIAPNKVVTLEYQVTDINSNELLESSEKTGPMVYLHGANNIIPNLETALAGKAVGDAIEIVLEPDQAYGEHSMERVQKVPRSVFEGIDNLEPGMKLNAETDSGPLTLLVISLDDESVTVDANHPLSGKTLKFNVSIQNIRDASAEELDHGHVHGEGGHHH